MTNEGVGCKFARVRNCGAYYVYQMQKPTNWYYGFCVAQDQCTDARELGDRWRLITNPTIRAQSNSADQTTKKGWYRFTAGHGTMATYQPDSNYGGKHQLLFSLVVVFHIAMCLRILPPAVARYCKREGAGFG